MGRSLRNPEVLNLQISLLNKRNLTELVERKKKKKSFLKIAIFLFLFALGLVAIFSLTAISTNKDSQRSTAAAFERWLSERGYG